MILLRENTSSLNLLAVLKIFFLFQPNQGITRKSCNITKNDQQILPVQRNQENQRIPLAAFGGILASTATQNDQQILTVHRNQENRRILLAAFGGILAWTVTKNDQQILPVQRNLDPLCRLRRNLGMDCYKK